MRIAIVSIVLLALASCKEKKTEEQAPELKNFKERVSYAIGADHAGQLVNSNDPNFDKYNKAEIVKGFEAGLKNVNAMDAQCEQSIRNLVGPTQRGFNAKYAKEASNCIGKFMGSVFLAGWTKNGQIGRLDLKLVRYGFEKALYKQDTLLGSKERLEVVQNFLQDINRLLSEQNDKRDKAYFATLANKPGLEKLENGIYLEVLQPGSGGHPKVTDDIDADYILMHTAGDTVQSSFEARKRGQKIIFNLQEVVPGWQIGFQHMQKGGKYKLYVPTEMGYGPNPPDQAVGPMVGLVFYIELHNYATGGTLKKKQ